MIYSYLMTNNHYNLNIFLFFANLLWYFYRRQMKRSKSMLQTILFGNDDSEDDAKSKNIRQTGTYAQLCEIFNKICFYLI